MLVSVPPVTRQVTLCLAGLFPSIKLLEISVHVGQQLVWHRSCFGLRVNQERLADSDPCWLRFYRMLSCNKE
jgi:hypothetical protein